mmetsp:Transcript_22678/g.31666  ORF Transcript_22678/g.31666 Transcript_22678/m.31666 type:complete len:268 (-) Transcript_22678:185-988(-)
MASSGSGYDLSSSTFSPDGRIFQVEYANKAVENAGTCIGIKCTDGVVMGVTKPLLHKMLLANSGKRIHTVSDTCGIAMTGFVPDGRQVVNRGRDEATNYKETYGQAISPQILSDRCATFVHYFTLHGSLRPFGATSVIGGYDEETKEHSLYMVEPNGVAFSYYACAAGKGRQPAKTELEKLELHKTPISTEDAVKQIVRIIHMLHDSSKDKPFELELSWICEASGWKHTGVPQDKQKAAVEWAKEQLEEEEDEDESEDEEDGDEMEE